MASTPEKVKEDTTVPPTLKLGDLICTKIDDKTWIAVICPDFGSYKDRNNPEGSPSMRRENDVLFYHVQRLGFSYDQAWQAESNLTKLGKGHEKSLNHLNLRFRENRVALDDYKMIVEKTNEERVELCRVRFSHNNELKTLNTAFKDWKDIVKSQKQDCASAQQSLKNELKTLKDSHDDLKNSFQELKNLVTSQNANPNKPKNEIETDEPSEKKTKLEKKKYMKKSRLELRQENKKLSQENAKLREENSKLQNDNLNLSKENFKLSKTIEEAQKQNEAVKKNLQEDILKLLK